eukprot:1619774-Rhodomonas_salina.3
MTPPLLVQVVSLRVIEFGSFIARDSITHQTAGRALRAGVWAASQRQIALPHSKWCLAPRARNT